MDLKIGDKVRSKIDGRYEGVVEKIKKNGQVMVRWNSLRDNMPSKSCTTMDAHNLLRLEIED